MAAGRGAINANTTPVSSGGLASQAPSPISAQVPAAFVMPLGWAGYQVQAAQPGARVHAVQQSAGVSASTCGPTSLPSSSRLKARPQVSAAGWGTRVGLKGCAGKQGP